MSIAVKRKLSGSTDGMGIKVEADSTPGTTIHTAVASTAAGTYDEIWLWACCNDDEDAELTIELGSDDAEQNIVVSVPAGGGLTLILPGLILQNEAEVAAFADMVDVVTIHGFVNSMEDPTS